MRKTEVQLLFYRQEIQRVGQSDMMTSEGSYRFKYKVLIMNRFWVQLF